MMNAGFLTAEDRLQLIALARKGSAASRVTRRANALAPLGAARANVRSSRQAGVRRINIHGAIDLETERTWMIEVKRINALSTIQLLEAIEALIRC